MHLLRRPGFPRRRAHSGECVLPGRRALSLGERPSRDFKNGDSLMKRGRFDGTKQILQFNWPFYAIAAPLLVTGAAALKLRRWPRLIAAGGAAGIAASAFWMVASVAASWWVYDASPIMKWRWLRDYFPTAPSRWANFHAGLDESTPALRELFGTDGIAFDFFEAATMTEPSIRRARALYSPDIEADNVDFRALPLEDGALDAAFVFFAAHEIRNPRDREAFVAELHRVLAIGGQLVLLEHVRDAANFAVFGPGAFHFWSAEEWRRLTRPGFEVEVETRMTPFVRLWIWRKTA
ncbi:class I SAM-dependent methyltransferase [bacterium]|nr:MAG: class I SAM-dependent methyltransferase [bacterium]